MVHGGNVTSLFDRNCLSRFDCEWQERVVHWANLVCRDGANGVNDPSVVAKVVDFLPGTVNAEFAVGLDERGTTQVEGAQAVFHDVCLQQRPSITEEGAAQALAIGQVRG